MFSVLEQFDQTLFLLINGCNSPFFDQIMWFISGKLSWLPLYLLLLYGVFKQAGKYWWLTLLAIILLITLADQISVAAFKNTVMRYRPCHNLDLMDKVHLVKEHCGGQYGFVSSHASNFFAMAMFFSLYLSRKWITLTLFFIAALVGYSRIYLGVHYPADVLVGGMVGATIGWGVFKLFKLAETQLARKSK